MINLNQHKLNRLAIREKYFLQNEPYLAQCKG